MNKPLAAARFFLLAATLFGTTAFVHAASGSELFGKHCVACHQADGEGIPGLAPPLVGALHKVAEAEAGRTYIAQVLLSGMAGTIRTRGAKFTGVMPSQSALSDHELAGIASYVLSAFNGSSVAFEPERFASLRAQPLPPAEVRKLREQVLAQVGG